jgi:hypothetical protein
VSIRNWLSFSSLTKPTQADSEPAAQTALQKYLKCVTAFLDSPKVLDQITNAGLTIDFQSIEDAMRDAGWLNNRPLFVPSGSLSPVADALAAAHAEIAQLKFLLASAPMIEIPAGFIHAREFVKRAGATFAYVNPRTMAMITYEPLQKYFMVFPGSKTKWVLTSLMPEQRVIFTPLAIPGLEKILAG